MYASLYFQPFAPGIPKTSTISLRVGFSAFGFVDGFGFAGAFGFAGGLGFAGGFGFAFGIEVPLPTDAS